MNSVEHIYFLPLKIYDQPHPSSEKIVPIGRRPDPGSNNSQKMELPIGLEPAQSIRRHDNIFPRRFTKQQAELGERN